MIGEAPKVERPPSVHCPFCGWHRIPNMDKSAGPPPEGFQARAIEELGQHIWSIHRTEWSRLVSAFDRVEHSA